MLLVPALRLRELEQDLAVRSGAPGGEVAVDGRLRALVGEVAAPAPHLLAGRCGASSFGFLLVADQRRERRDEPDVEEASRILQHGGDRQRAPLEVPLEPRGDRGVADPSPRQERHPP